MKKTISLMICLILLPLFGCGSSQEMTTAPAQKSDFTMAIAWTDEPEAYSIQLMGVAARETGEDYITLDMIRSYDLTYDDQGNLVDAVDEHGMLTSEAARVIKENTWLNSNVEEVMEDVDCIIFPGGKDISPTLYYHEQSWHGIEEDTDYSAERDVSDYLLMDYCLEHDIPVLAICRGMQMLSTVSGADMIQDIPTWLSEQGIQYTDIHRDPEKKDLVPHSVDVLSKDSLLYHAAGKTRIDGCPSWHHQMVRDVTGTRLTVVAQTDTDGITTIEAVERKYRTFCLGLQFHPEVAVGKIVNKEANAGDFFDYDTAMSFFRALVEAGKEYEQQGELQPAA
jgi:putative glutamine amidotransferase